MKELFILFYNGEVYHDDDGAQIFNTRDEADDAIDLECDLFGLEFEKFSVRKFVESNS